MALKSMTGFARAAGSVGTATWSWELRSVNGRGLDVRLRLAPGTEDLEPQVRALVARHLQRGSVQVGLQLAEVESHSVVRLNERALADVLAAAERVRALTRAPPPSVEGILALRGVLEVVERETDAGALAERTAALLLSLEAGLRDLAAARVAEGARLESVLLAQLTVIAETVETIRAAPARSMEAIRARLSEQVARLVGASPALDPARLHQETAMLATKADVGEELDRLAAHVAAVRELIAGDAQAGRKLDFLAQELNREANTLCAKSNDTEITRLGLALKVAIDQMREQIQNIE